MSQVCRSSRGRGRVGGLLARRIRRASWRRQDCFRAGSSTCGASLSSARDRPRVASASAGQLPHVPLGVPRPYALRGGAAALLQSPRVDCRTVGHPRGVGSRAVWQSPPRLPLARPALRTDRDPAPCSAGRATTSSTSSTSSIFSTSSTPSTSGRNNTRWLRQAAARVVRFHAAGTRRARCHAALPRCLCVGRRRR